MSDNVVAFLQNMWVRDMSRARESIARHGDLWRRRATFQFLFSGCITGRRLTAAFGEELCKRIVWEESTKEIAGDPRTTFPADPDHIRAVLDEFKPKLVLTFGKIATTAVEPLWDGAIITAPHPASRQPDIALRLAIAAGLLRHHLSP